MDLNPHLIQYDYLAARTPDGDEVQRHTTKGATCTCGRWEAWSSDGQTELEQLHDMHLQYIKKKTEQAFIRQHTRDVSRHTLRWRGANAAQCDWCNWQVTNMTPEAIHEAFSAHKERIRKEAANQ
ncbi:MAG: hypothetical protein U0223_11675 [Nitrospira sp.]|nr:hypothetical protein [Nitrospira sp.]